MKEQILETLVNIGFKPEYEEDFGYIFEYEGTNYIYMPIENDECFLSIAVPGAFELDNLTEGEVANLINIANTSLKYVKASIYFGRIWLFYEREIFDGDNFEIIVPVMINHLDNSFRFLNSERNKIVGGNENHDDKTEESTGEETADGMAEGGDEEERNN